MPMTPESDAPDEKLDPLLLDALREHADALSPDGPSRDRIWQKIHTGLTATPQAGLAQWWASLVSSPRHWAPVFALTLAVAVGIPVLMLQQPAPDWSSTEYKGAKTVRISAAQRDALLADLRQNAIAFTEAPALGPGAIAITAQPGKPANPQIAQSWGISVPDAAPLVLVFE